MVMHRSEFFRGVFSRGQHRTKAVYAAFVLLWSLSPAALTACSAAPARVNATPSDWASYTIVIRAADPDWSKMSTTAAKAGQELCALGLSLEGAALAKQAGQALQARHGAAARALEITIDGDCLSRETAQALGLPAKVAPELTPGRSSGLAGRMQGLRDLMSRPAKGAAAPRLMIVSDDLIFGAFGMQVQEGEGFLLRSAEQGGYEIIKRLNQRWWEDLPSTGAAGSKPQDREKRWASQAPSPGT